MDLRVVKRAIRCRRPSCGAGPGGWCRTPSGNTTPTFHAERTADALAMTPEEQAAAVAQADADRRARIAAMDTNLTPEQQATRDAVSAAWDRILQETR